MKEGFLNIAGVSTYYTVAGKGPPLVLVHGFGGSTIFWQRNMEPLARQCQVFALDLPGFGRSPKPPLAYDLSYGIGVLSQFLDALGLERASFAGHSMGGLLSMAMALEHPQRVERLALVDTAGLGKEVQLQLRVASVPVLGELLLGRSRWAIKREMGSLFYARRYLTDDLVDDVYESRRSPGGRRAFFATLRNGVTFFGFRDRVILRGKLHQLAIPTLILWGAQDRVIPAAYAHIGHQNIRGAMLHIFDECGHCPQIEKADQFNELVMDFLKRV